MLVLHDREASLFASRSRINANFVGLNNWTIFRNDTIQLNVTPCIIRKSARYLFPSSYAIITTIAIGRTCSSPRARFVRRHVSSSKKRFESWERDDYDCNSHLYHRPDVDCIPTLSHFSGDEATKTNGYGDGSEGEG
jgi:hypothetical protein